jgi:hypothetical protein
MKKENEIKKEDVEKVDKEILSNIFDSILASAEKENKELYGAVMKNIKTKIDNPEDFDLFFFYPLRSIVEGSVHSAIKETKKEYDNKEMNRRIDRASFILTNHTYLEMNFRTIIRKIEGTSCEADKTRYLLNRIFRYYAFDEEINVIKTEKSYWIPNFWNNNKGQEWLDLFEALIMFYYGNSEKYLVFMRDRFIPLVNSRKDKKI